VLLKPVPTFSESIACQYQEEGSYRTHLRSFLLFTKANGSIHTPCAILDVVRGHIMVCLRRLGHSNDS
jgi:hypothetical protein